MHVIHSTNLNCFCQCGHVHERDAAATSDVDSSIEYEDAFHGGWIWQDTEYVSLSCISVDSEVAMCGD